MKVGG
jgi:hypothetical protein